jgi:predicted Rossmann fold flavoprotein
MLEKNDRVGKKLLRTGNGRCNLSNLRLSTHAYNHPDFTKPTLERFGCAELRAFFEGMGLWTVSDSEGRVYPYSDAAASVLDVLRLACAENGVTERCGFEAASLRPVSDGWVIASRGGEQMTADAVIVATGGGTALMEPLGHATVPFSPALCPIRTDTDAIRGLSGLRVRCRASLLENGREIAAETGELLFRDYGVSGVMVFDLSRFARAGQTLMLDLMPELSPDEAMEKLAARTAAFHGGADGLFTGIFRRRIAEAVIRRAGGTSPEALCRAVKQFRLHVRGLTDVAQAQGTKGGADVTAFGPDTLESRRRSGLYAVGEALDIDGRCGGYNLHWAFSSGIVAGEHAAGRTTDHG